MHSIPYGRAYYGLAYDPNSEILITVGGTQAIFLAMQALVEPGDEVLTPDPSFVCYEPSVNIADGVPVSTPLAKARGFSLDKRAVISHITGKSRIIIVNSPNNPTRAVLSHTDLSSLAKIAVERDLLVISDEVYERITYDCVGIIAWLLFQACENAPLLLVLFPRHTP